MFTYSTFYFTLSYNQINNVIISGAQQSDSALHIHAIYICVYIYIHTYIYIFNHFAAHLKLKQQHNQLTSKTIEKNRVFYLECFTN